MTGRGCVWEVLSGDSLIVTYYESGATAEQWSAYGRMMQTVRGRAARYLIYCASVPPPDVLAQLASAARGQPWQVALISPSTAVRFAASTFAMIVRGFRFFPPEDLERALEHLQCDKAEQQRARSALLRCQGIELPQT